MISLITMGEMSGDALVEFVVTDDMVVKSDFPSLRTCRPKEKPLSAAPNLTETR